jgi:hypothetical protein
MLCKTLIEGGDCCGGGGGGWDMRIRGIWKNWRNTSVADATSRKEWHARRWWCVISEIGQRVDLRIGFISWRTWTFKLVVCIVRELWGNCGPYYPSIHLLQLPIVRANDCSTPQGCRCMRYNQSDTNELLQYTKLKVM